MMDEIPGTLSEYEEAKRRFSSQKSGDSSTSEEPRELELIRKLCTDESFELFNGENTFFDLIFHADFIQIKDEVKAKFYKNLCKTFLFSDHINNVISNLYMLNDFPHVKLELIKQMCKVFGITATLYENILTLTHKQEQKWDCSEIKEIIVEQCAFKIMCCQNEKFKLLHLNFVFQLCDTVEVVDLRKCNLNGKDVENLFVNLKLKKANLSKCGSSVNHIIQKCASKAFQFLEELDISYNPLSNETLRRLQYIPLKKLIALNTFKNNGVHCGEMWVSEYFKVNSQTENAENDIDILWEDGILKENLNVLSLSDFVLSDKNLENISRLNLKSLHLNKCIKGYNLDLLISSELLSKLKELKIKNICLHLDDLKIICNLRMLEVLEFEFYGMEEDDYSTLDNTPIFPNLNQLSVNCEFESNCLDFPYLISRLKLEKLKFVTRDECRFEVLFYCHDDRAYLKSLYLSVPCFEITNEIVLCITEMNSLETLSFSLAESSSKFRDILSCENLQKSLTTLNLLGKEIGDDDLIELMKYEKLENVSFEFGSNLNEINLKTFFDKKTLKKTDITASVHGRFELNLARSICIAPVRKINFYDDYSKSISEEAFRYLSNPNSLSKFSSHLKDLYLRTKLKNNLAEILRNVNWESIHLDNCVLDEDDSFTLMMSNENLHYSLYHLSMIETNALELILKTLERTHLSILEIQIPAVEKSEVFEHILSGCISKSLRILTLELCTVPIDIFKSTNLSIIDNFLVPYFSHD